MKLKALPTCIMKYGGVTYKDIQSDLRQIFVQTIPILYLKSTEINNIKKKTFTTTLFSKRKPKAKYIF